MLRVDLSNSGIVNEAINPKWVENYIGGKGLGARYLYELLPPRTDPLSPENVLIMITGPLTGTIASTMSRIAVVTKSPATGTFLDSYAGGYFPAELKFSGFDGIIFRGKSPRPAYLWVKDGEARLEDASHLWGEKIRATVDDITRELKDRSARVAAIGPAGENFVKFASIAFDKHHFAGRGGAGAVMGSKNLKAIAVRGTRGVKSLEINLDPRFKELARRITIEGIRKNPAVQWAVDMGTPAILDYCNSAGLLPTRNFQSGTFEGVRSINFESMKKKILNKHYSSCFTCSIGCRNLTSVKDGRYAGAEGEGPEYETLALAGSNCGVSSIEAISKFNELCGEYGLDTITAGATVGFAMELFERGIIREDQTDGLRLKFGNEDSYVKLLELIAFRKGIGNILAEGVKRASEVIGNGSERYAIHVKGLEYPGYDPRGAYGMALAYATSDRGACHNRAFTVQKEAFGNVDPFTTEGKAELVYEDQLAKSIRWSLIACDFLSVDYPVMTELLSLVMGRPLAKGDLVKVGKRIWNLTRLFNVREGFTRKHDTIPQRIVEESLPSGSYTGRIISQAGFQKMLDEYYEIWCWDREGRPLAHSPEALEV